MGTSFFLWLYFKTKLPFSSGIFTVVSFTSGIFGTSDGDTEKYRYFSIIGEIQKGKKQLRVAGNLHFFSYETNFKVWVKMSRLANWLLLESKLKLKVKTICQQL